MGRGSGRSAKQQAITVALVKRAAIAAMDAAAPFHLDTGMASPMGRTPPVADRSTQATARDSRPGGAWYAHGVSAKRGQHVMSEAGRRPVHKLAGEPGIAPHQINRRALKGVVRPDREALALHRAHAKNGPVVTKRELAF